MNSVIIDNNNSCDDISYHKNYYLDEKYHFIFDMFELSDIQFYESIFEKMDLLINIDDEIIDNFEVDVSIKLRKLKHCLIKYDQIKKLRPPPKNIDNSKIIAIAYLHSNFTEDF